MTTQKQATYNAIISTFGADYELNGEVRMRDVFTKDMKAQALALLVAGFNAGEIELKSQQDDIEKYAKGLLNNWLLKGEEFNCGEKHETKNKGSRSKDAQIVELNKVKKFLTQNGQDTTEVEKAIESRLNEIRPKSSGAKQISKDDIDLSALPSHLRNLI